MTRLIHGRSFTAGGGGAFASPSQSTITIQTKLYRDVEDFVPFRSFGVYEEAKHGKQSWHGLIRTIHILEQDSQAQLAALINGREDIETAKEAIIQNELACEHLYTDAHSLVETLDQYAALVGFQRMLEKNHELEDNEIASFRFSETIGADQMQKRGTIDSELYQKLERLEDKFDTSLVPRIAGILALNIPLVDTEDAPQERTQSVCQHDIQERFEVVFSTLMETITPIQALTTPDPDWSGEFGDAFATFLGNLVNELPFAVSTQGLEAKPLPLLDIPLQTAPSAQKIRETTDINEDDSNAPRRLLDLLSDAAMLFSSYGCVIIDPGGGRPITYFPNVYVAGEQIGTEHYLHALYEFSVASSVIAQLVGQSDTVPTLHCPFCDVAHDPRQERCTWNANRSQAEKQYINTDRWEGYVEQTVPLVEDFVSVEVPGEDHLAAMRDKHRSA